MKANGKRLTGAAILALTAGYLAGASSLAQPGPISPLPQAKIDAAAALPTPRLNGHPDLTGFWPGPRTSGDAPPPDKPITPQGNSTRPMLDSIDSQVAGEASRVAARKADPSLRPTYKPQFVAKAKNNFEKATSLDPTFKCLPQGVPRIGTPTEIVQHGDTVVFLYPYGDSNNTLTSFRVIPTDNRKHDPDADAMPNGDSVGHWEGDTLVIDVTNIDPDTWMDIDGSFHDSKLHLIEKFTRKGNTLRYELTAEDPTLFAKPFVAEPKTMLLGPPRQHVGENYPCQERDQANLKNRART